MNCPLNTIRKSNLNVLRYNFIINYFVNKIIHFRGQKRTLLTYIKVSEKIYLCFYKRYVHFNNTKLYLNTHVVSMSCV